MSDSIWTRIEQARARCNVLEHPFYQRWSAGELTPEELASYSGQYRHATQAIAEMSARVADAAPVEARDGLRRHADEEAAHVSLWDGFVTGVGGSTNAPANTETADCVAVWTEDDGALPTLARLYAIESGQPEISKVKRDGLLKLYDVNEGPATEYFRVHETLDADHAAEARALIESIATDGDGDDIVAAAEGAFRANWRLLDGV